jgi:Fic family protein
MEKNSLLLLQEVVLGSKDPSISNHISDMVKQGILRKIAPRIYTSNFDDSAERIIKRNIFLILGKLFPGVLLSHRSALEFQPTKEGLIFLTTSYTKKIKLPGITLQFLEGQGPTTGDTLFTPDLYVSQTARALLENMQVSKKVGTDSKCMELAAIETRLDQIIRIHGENELNKLRDAARKISVLLSMQKEFEKLNRLISALLSTNTSRMLTSPIAQARAFGLPYDPARIDLFENLFRLLKTSEFPYRQEKNISSNSFRNFAFFESYFSNYIEGTVFEIDEAKKIIETNRPMPLRTDDSHDVLGTFQIASNKREMETIPTSADHFISILQVRHAILLRARIDKKPGMFKDKNNFAGSTAFVDFNLVKGTLVKAFDYYNTLEHPFSRAAFIMFVVSEVHPFLDGNGRIARVMMNAELVKGGQSKIIIPTVFRDDYIGALKKLTKHGKPDTYINMLLRAQEFSSNVYSESMDEMQVYLQNCNAFSDDSDEILRIAKRD